MDNTSNAERIADLRRIRAENNLSIQQVYDLLEASGDPLSMTTVKKIFSVGTESCTVSARSIRQVERVLCGIFGSAVEPTESELIEELRTQNQFMRDMIVEMNGQMRLILDLCERRSELWQKS